MDNRPKDWEKFAADLHRSLVASEEGYTLLDVIDQIDSGEAQWHVFNDCAIVTQLSNIPKGRVCIFWLVAGPLEELKKAEERVMEWAKQIECVEARYIGRKGWLRALSSEWKSVGVAAVRKVPDTI